MLQVNGIFARFGPLMNQSTGIMLVKYVPNGAIWHLNLSCGCYDAQKHKRRILLRRLNWKRCHFAVHWRNYRRCKKVEGVFTIHRRHCITPGTCCNFRSKLNSNPNLQPSLFWYFALRAWQYNCHKFQNNFTLILWYFILTDWGQMTYICVSKLIIIGSNNGLSPGRRQTII